jgi:hypothetical protein
MPKKYARDTIPHIAGYPLTPSMQNRRIIDTNFRAAGVEISAAIETSSLVTLWSHIRFGHWSTVVPNTFLLLLRQQESVIALPLVASEVSHVLGLVVPDREPTRHLRANFSKSPNRSILARELGSTRHGRGRQ